MKKKVNRNGYPIAEYRLMNKHGEVIYKRGTLYEVATYALENQFLIMRDEKE